MLVSGVGFHIAAELGRVIAFFAFKFFVPIHMRITAMIPGKILLISPVVAILAPKVNHRMLTILMSFHESHVFTHFAANVAFNGHSRLIVHSFFVLIQGDFRSANELAGVASKRFLLMHVIVSLQSRDGDA